MVLGSSYMDGGGAAVQATGEAKVFVRYLGLY